MHVVVLGASDKPDRYSYKAVRQLLAHGHEVYPVHPVIKSVLDQPCFKNLNEINIPIDTLTLYINPELSAKITQDILRLKPRRVIFNPGTENPELSEILSRNGIEALEACTLVMLNTAQF